MSIIALIFVVISLVKILSKAGFSGIFVILLFIPIVNLLALIFFAYTKWPIELKIDIYKKVIKEHNLEKEIEINFREIEQTEIDKKAKAICTKCGKIIENDSNICSNCGNNNGFKIV